MNNKCLKGVEKLWLKSFYEYADEVLNEISDEEKYEINYQKGYEYGVKKMEMDVAIALLKENIDLNIISKITKISSSGLLYLKNKMNI